MKLQNKFLIYLAKTFGLILYWALVALFVWLFYDSYITEDKWTDLFYSISFLSLGCALKPIFIVWLFEKEWQQFAQKREKAAKLLEKIAGVCSIIFGAVARICFLMGIAGLTLGIYLYGLAKLVICTWPYWLGLAIMTLVCIALRASTSPVVRIVRKLIYRALLILTVLLIIYIEIFYVWNGTIHDEFTTDALIGGSVLLLFVAVALLAMFFISLKKGIFTFATNKFVLFLRSFRNDNDALYNRISQSIPDFPIMKIGDPNIAESENVNEHWLPMSNWKFFLRFYISKARAIIIAISSTEGVLWEVVQNLKQLNKCVFYFDTIDDLRVFKTKLEAINTGHLDVVVHAIEKLIHPAAVPHKAFIIHDNTIYVGDVAVLTNAVLCNSFQDVARLDVMVAPTTQPSQKRNRIVSVIFNKLHILNLLNSVEGIHNTVIRGVLMSVTVIVVVAFYLGYFIAGLCLMCSPLFLFLDSNLSNISIVEKIIMCGFGLGLGRYILKDIYKTIIKKEGL